MGLTPEGLVAGALAHPVNAALVERLAPLALPQGFLVAGCLFQSVWNRQAGRAPGWGGKDYDVFYFDGGDLSWEAEDAVIRRVRAVTADLGVEVEVKNQARVHLWYRERFGLDYPRLASARDGIARYLVACTCVGLELAGGALHAPHGLEELGAGVLRMNPWHPAPALFVRKAQSYRARWPWLTVLPPDPAGGTAPVLTA